MKNHLKLTFVFCILCSSLLFSKNLENQLPREVKKILIGSWTHDESFDEFDEKELFYLRSSGEETSLSIKYAKSLGYVFSLYNDGDSIPTDRFNIFLRIDKGDPIEIKPLSTTTKTWDFIFPKEKIKELRKGEKLLIKAYKYEQGYIVDKYSLNGFRTAYDYTMHRLEGGKRARLMSLTDPFKNSREIRRVLATTGRVETKEEREEFEKKEAEYYKAKKIEEEIKRKNDEKLKEKEIEELKVKYAKRVKLIEDHIKSLDKYVIKQKGSKRYKVRNPKIKEYQNMLRDYKKEHSYGKKLNKEKI